MENPENSIENTIEIFNTDAPTPLIFDDLPTVSFGVDKTVIIEGGDPQLTTFNLSQPAPAGGLPIKLRIDDPDGEPGDTDNALELFSNITDFGDAIENGVFVANITIAEGETEATIGIKALADNQVEGSETYSLTLLENENYIVDPASTTITTTIEEFMIPTVSISPETVVTTEGDSYVWNFSLDQPVPPDGLTLNLIITQESESSLDDGSPNFEASSGVSEGNLLFGENGTILGFTLPLVPGITEASLVIDTVADDILETDEISTIAIADGEDYRVNPNQNSLTNIFTDRTVVTLTTDEVSVTEGETFAWNFSLNRPAPEGGLTLSLPITFNNDPEPGDVIYDVEGSTNISDFGFITQDDVSVGFTLTIPEGETEATLVSEAVVDDIAEFDEIFTTVLADGNDYVANPVGNQVVTTIVEDGVAPPSSAPVVSITPEAVISTEGETFAWDITLDQPVPVGGLTLSLPITQNNDPLPGDVIYNVEGSTGISDFEFIVEDDISIGFSVTLEEGVTSATLVSEAVADDDDIEEAADEIFTTVLADGNDYRANPDSNEVQTILTRETVVSFTPEQVNVTEGDTFAWNFSLNQPAPEGGLNLSLPITFNNDPEPGDVIYNVEGSTNISDFSFIIENDISIGFNVTIAEGETEATLVSEAVADDIAEVSEIFTTILNDGAGYRSNPLSKEVVTTIVEQDSSSTPVVSLTPATVTATEGETFAWNLSLDQPAPSGGLSLFLPITENSDPAPGDVEYFVEGSNNISDFEFVTTSSISQIYAFGDSYSDDGLSFEISTDAVAAGVEDSFILPADPDRGLYDPEGRWTNGPTAVEVLSDTLDVALTDYAVGGAKSGAGNYYSWLDSFQDTGVFGQIDQYSTELAGASADPDALYFIFASANDLFEYTDFGLPGTVEELAAQTVENIVEGVTDLSELGAQQFLIVNSSDLDILPGVIEFGQVEEATVFTDEVNELLPEALAAISQELGVEIALYDHVAISDEIRSNPQDFGLTNVDDPYQPVFPVEPPAPGSPDEYYFWDEYHPTRRVHEIIGEDMASFVNSEIEDDDVSVGFNLTIAEGATEATLVSEVVADDIEEGLETFTTAIAESETYRIDPTQNQVITNLLDSGDSSTMIPTLSFSEEIAFATEGDQFAWNLSLDQPVPNGGLTINVVFTQNTEPKPGDVISNIEASTGVTNRTTLLGDGGIILGFALTLAEGVTEAQLILDTVVNNIQETDEISILTIADGEDYRANPNQNSLNLILTDQPVVTFTSEQLNVAEGETFAWNFSLNRPAPEGGLTLSLPITQNNDPAPGDVIYNVEGSTNISDFGFITQDDVSIGFTLTIPEGETEATLVSQAVADDGAEFDEIFTTVLADGVNYIANPASNQVVTTIVDPDSSTVEPDSSSVPVVSITPSALISTEGETFAWDFTLDQPVPEGGLTLSLPITQNNDPAPGDVIYNVEGSIGITDFDFIVEDDISIGFSVTLEEGITSATLVSEAVVDDNDLEEFADEIFTTVLADGVDYRANPDSNEVQTFITGQTVVSFTPEQVNVAEGETFAWNFSLNKPAPVGGLTLSLPITFNNDPEPGDVIYNVNGSSNITDFDFLVVDDISVGFTLTIAEGETEATLVSQAVADDLEEFDEIFTTILNDGDNYRSNPLSKEVVTTIVEQDSSPTISVFAEPTEVEEGSQLLWNFDLTEAVPSGGLAVDLDLVEDTDPLPGDITYFVEGSENITDFELVIDESTGLIDKAVVTLAPGATSATLVSDIIADNATEGPESVSFALAEVEGYSIDGDVNAASFTILDTSTSEPTISVFAEPTEVEEGSQLLWNFSLTEAVPSGGLAVDLDLVEDTDPLPGDITYFVEGSENITDFELVIDESTGLIDKAVVTLAPGATSATLVSDIIADNTTEGPESVSFALAEVEGYTVDSDVNAASFTILDTSTGNDTIVGDDGDNILEGNDSDNLIAGGLGNDEITGAGGDDVLRGDLNSRSSGGTVGGNDTLRGGAGNDRIGGKAGDDELFGDEGDDILFGDDGDDLIRGGLGNDLLFGDDFSGGAGADTFVLAAGEGSDTIFDFEVGVDIIGLADGLTVEDLTVTTSGSTTIAFGDETLAVLESVAVSASEIDYALV
ncbi:MAG: SGNH/GDSL hydrolase family protein [Microcoleaceae cyanobacterium]